MFGCVDAAPLSASEPSVTRTWPRPAEELRAHEPVSTEAVIVVVLDGARWQDVLVGVDPSLGASLPASQIVTADRLMPNLHAMIARGALVGGPDQGMPMVASGPNYVSLPGYNEIFSGRFPARCQDNECPQTRDATLARRRRLLLLGAHRSRRVFRRGLRARGSLRLHRPAVRRVSRRP
jgi:hypothetical protein